MSGGRFARSLDDLHGRLPAHLGRRITAVDSHTAGESTRVVLAGMPDLSDCPSVLAKRRALSERFDDLRRLVTREPRGHRDIIGAWATEPSDRRADFGVVFMDARRYPFACGTATVGAVTTLVELGLVAPRGADGEVVADTPAGLLRTRVERDGERVRSVTLDMVPSCVTATAVPLALGGAGRLEADLVHVGGFLALVSSEQLPFALELSHAREIVELGDRVVAAANAQHAVEHPDGGEASTVDGAVFYDPAGHRERRGYGTVVYGASHLDRSPCGTGTAAKMTLLHRRGELAVGDRFTSRGILGTEFEGRLDAEVPVGRFAGVRSSIRASAHVVGIHELCLDADGDPFPEGLLVL